MPGIADRIKKLRKDMGLSQAVFVLGLGITRSYLSMIERGRANPSKQLIKSISRYYLVREEWLKEGKGEMINDEPFTPEQIQELEFYGDQMEYMAIEEHLEYCDSLLDHLNNSLKEIRNRIVKLKKEAHEFFHKSKKKS